MLLAVVSASNPAAPHLPAWLRWPEHGQNLQLHEGGLECAFCLWWSSFLGFMLVFLVKFCGKLVVSFGCCGAFSARSLLLATFLNLVIISQQLLYGCHLKNRFIKQSTRIQAVQPSPHQHPPNLSLHCFCFFIEIIVKK